MSLSDMLPGVGHFSAEERRIFESITTKFVASVFCFEKRLGSPQHYRLYFAFSQPSGALQDEQVDLFIETAKDSPGKRHVNVLEL